MIIDLPLPVMLLFLSEVIFLVVFLLSEYYFHQHKDILEEQSTRSS